MIFPYGSVKALKIELLESFEIAENKSNQQYGMKTNYQQLNSLEDGL